MCRWIAYIGAPIKLSTLIVSPSHSLIRQGTHTKMSFDSCGSLLRTNGDGYGAGWYDGEDEQPCVVKGADPIWNSENFINICNHVKSALFMAHARLTTTGQVHRYNAHPFHYKNWLFQHNGEISDFPKIRRSLQMDIAPDLYPHLQGTTDSETFFLLALTYGLETNPKRALQKLVTRLRQAAKDHDTQGKLNLSCVMSDGQNLYTIRYSENAPANTQFYSHNTESLGDFSDDYETLPKHNTVFVSEPLDDLSDKWTEVPVNSFTHTYQGNSVIESLMDE